MIEIKRMSIYSEDAGILLNELNEVLRELTGDDGTSHFRQEDTEQERSIFLVGYIDGIPCGCGALREINQDCGEVKRIYARRNSCRMGQKILKAIEQEAVSFHYKKLFLETRIQNKHAIEFYKNNGYLHCPNYGVYKDSLNSYCFMKNLEQ